MLIKDDYLSRYYVSLGQSTQDGNPSSNGLKMTIPPDYTTLDLPNLIRTSHYKSSNTNSIRLELTIPSHFNIN